VDFEGFREYNEDTGSKEEMSRMKKMSITGGTTLIGLGVGFILFKHSVFYFIASLFIGIGVGLLIEYLTKREK
jgi:putative flippase GtrA